MIRVGVVGANPDRGWASRAHMPALTAMSDLTLAAVATTRADSAHGAAREFGAEHTFTDARSLAEHPDVDLVAITVKVPAHDELVGIALAAGKHVLCEWPLALNTDQATALADDAERAGVLAAVGLQTRFAPALVHARTLIAAGHIGTVGAATLLTTRAKAGDGAIPAWAAYTLDRANGAGTLEVMGGHALDALEYLLGPFDGLSAELAVRHPRLQVAESGHEVTVTSPDHLVLAGVLHGGVPVTVALRDAESAPPRTRLEIAGSAGNLAIVSRAGGSWEDTQFSVGHLDLLSSTHASDTWQPVHIPPKQYPYDTLAPVGARNVAGLYQRIADDLRTGQRHAPSFTDGVHLHHLLDAIRTSHTTASRVTPADHSSQQDS